MRLLLGFGKYLLHLSNLLRNEKLKLIKIEIILSLVLESIKKKVIRAIDIYIKLKKIKLKKLLYNYSFLAKSVSNAP